MHDFLGTIHGMGDRFLEVHDYKITKIQNMRTLQYSLQLYVLSNVVATAKMNLISLSFDLNRKVSDDGCCLLIQILSNRCREKLRGYQSMESLNTMQCKCLKVGDYVLFCRI